MMRTLILIILMIVGTASLAVEPNEVLSDQSLEQRARDISKGLRCPVCQNESIDESSADLAADLRILVRERLVAGDNDQEVIDYIVNRYGEFVLLKPSTQGGNLILWLTAPILFLMASIIALDFVRRRPRTTGTQKSQESLTEAEQEKMRKIMEND